MTTALDWKAYGPTLTARQREELDKRTPALFDLLEAGDVQGCLRILHAVQVKAQVPEPPPTAALPPVGKLRALLSGDGSFRPEPEQVSE